MSPGVTFERVYHELKRMLAEGELPPGMPIEPAVIGKRIASSITPVRDALHRLTGERLVEAPNHNGFRVPLLTESAIRDLYSWNAQLLGLATRRIRAGATGMPAAPIMTAGDVPSATATLFVEIARATTSLEHARAIQQLNDRLAPLRRVEAGLFDGLVAELSVLFEELASGDRTRITVQLARYHQRRLKSVSHIAAAVAFPTLRATRPKAALMVNARIDIERWADGGAPEAKARDLIIATGRYNGLRVLILRYRTWKPLRLTREQAKMFLKFLDPIRSFANAQRTT